MSTGPLAAWIPTAESILKSFDRFMEEVGAESAEATHMAVLRPVARTQDLDPSVEEVMRLSAPFRADGQAVVVRGGETGRRLFAFRDDAFGRKPPMGAFMWIPVHSGLSSWWLLTAWRSRQMGEAVLALAQRQLPLPAAACARSLLETAAAARYDVNRWTTMWRECRRYAPTAGEVVPSSLYQPLHNYVVEVLVGGRFEGEMPLDVRLLAAEPIKRTNIKTCIDHLAKSEPSAWKLYEVLCNAVHPSVASTITFMQSVEAVALGESHNRFVREGVGVSGLSGQTVSTLTATFEAVELAMQVLQQSLDDALRAMDDICLTSRIGDYKAATHWRSIRSAVRNDRCPCRSGRKSKDCPHQWGTEDADLLQEEAIRSRQAKLAGGGGAGEKASSRRKPTIPTPDAALSGGVMPHVDIE
jgi:hypothetical protein